MNTTSIDTLYNRVRSGSVDAERELFERLSESFRLFAQHRLGDEHDAEETVQEALMTIAQKHRTTEFETSFKAWAYRILENKILDCRRARQNRRRRFAAMTGQESLGSRSDTVPALKRRLLECLQKLAGINSRFARVLSLHYQGYTTDEICERLAISRNGVYILLSRARTMLKLCLEKSGLRQ